MASVDDCSPVVVGIVNPRPRTGIVQNEPARKPRDRTIRRSMRAANARSLLGSRASAAECERVRRLGTSRLGSAK